MTAIRKRILEVTKGRFTPRQVSTQIRQYLKGKVACPWSTGHSLLADCESYGGVICKAALPRLPMCIHQNKMRQCPCHRYKKTYVIKRAREALK